MTLPGTAALRDLPSVDRLLVKAADHPSLNIVGREFLARECRAVLDDLRRAILAGAPMPPDACGEYAILDGVARRVAAARQPQLRRVVNASGTVLHTNLGRALLAPAAVEAVTAVAASASNLEYDVEHGTRGRRESEVERLLVSLTGAEAATVVNNNAAAVLVGVNSTAAGKGVLVSRGELVEIGGAFRIPEIVARSGATLREVGTTNRTHPADYERAIGPNTGLLLKVHTSNYRIVGFSSDVSLQELVAIGRRTGIPVMEDLGSGAVIDLSAYGLPKEPLVSERIAMGADLVTFSGDKLLGGPQAGLIAGTRAWIATVASNPLHRAVRCDKMALAALEATLRIYQQSPDPVRDIPTLSLLTRSIDEIASVAREAQPLLQAALGAGYRVCVEEGKSQVGSGALPTDELPTRVLVVVHDTESAEKIAARFRRATTPIVGRIHDGRFLLDVRTILDPADLIPGSPSSLD